MRKLALGLCLAVVAACAAGCTPPSGTGSDAGTVVPDAGREIPDAGLVPDAGAVPDAGSAPDAGDVPDAGAVPDAGDVSDAGMVPDAGDVPDAGTTPDAGDVPDAGTTPDAGPDNDAGVSAPATPTITPGTGTYTSAQTVVLATSTSGAEIHYTVDGSTPTSQSTLYSGPLTVAATETISAIATLVGAPDSAVATATLTIQQAPTDLVINEVGNAVYINFPCALEIYNPTSSPKDLSQYQLRTTARTVVTTTTNFPSAGVKNFPLPSLTVPPQGYVVIRGKTSADYVSGGTTIYLDDGASNVPSWWVNGFVELLDASGNTVDFVRFGSDTTAPSSASFSFNGAAPGFTSDEAHIGDSINRDVNSTNTRSASDWTLRAWMTLGGPNDVTTDSASDGDGIPDSAKVPGGTFAGLPLYAWGARRGQKDIFIHIDYMDPTQDPTSANLDDGILPDKRALDKAASVFAKHGYVVHFDVGDLFSPTAGDVANDNLDGRNHKVAWAQSVTLGQQSGFASAFAYKVSSMPAPKGRVFFYMLFGSSQNADGSDGSSGLASLPGNTSIVTLGRWGLTAGSSRLVNYQAATVVHEFGHNLGLKHGGDENLNYKPNYFSIMNYMYQLSGLPTVGVDDDTRYYRRALGQQGSLAYHRDRTDWRNWVASPDSDPSTFAIDYSDGSGAILNPNSLDDTKGIGRPGSVPIDFDISGSATNTNLTFDVIDFLSGTPNARQLHDFDDWGKISSVFQRTRQGYSTLASPLWSTMPTVRTIFSKPSTELSEPCAAQ